MADDLKTITVEISKSKSKSFLINTWYRPPDSPIELFDVYEEYVKKMGSENKEVTLIGDFNCDWTQLKKHKISPQTNRIVDFADLFQLQQLIKEPTRITQTSSTLIDLAFSNRPEIINTSCVEHLGISDHSLISICRKIPIPRKEPKLINTRQFKHYNINAFCSDLSKILQTQSADLLDPNALWEEWKNIFVFIADMHAPQVTKKVRSEYAPWITDTIKKSI